MTILVLEYTNVLNKKHSSEGKQIICSRSCFGNLFIDDVSPLSSPPPFFVCFYSSCMLPNLLQCKCLQEARYLAYPRVTLVLLYPLPASTQTRAQTALHPKARYCTTPCNTVILGVWVLACVCFLKASCVPQLQAALFSRWLPETGGYSQYHFSSRRTSAPRNHSLTISETDITSSEIPWVPLQYPGYHSAVSSKFSNR